jgi:hypothetical protein
MQPAAARWARIGTSTRLSTRHAHAFRDTICLQDARFYQLSKGNHVARSTRNDAQRQSALKVEPSLPDLVELAGSEDGLIGESVAVLDSLNLGHAGLRNECWPGASGRGLSSSRSEFAALRFATQRLRRPRRRRTQLHLSRPAQRAEARFTPDNREILTF